jgi:hypothetical protein
MFADFSAYHIMTERGGLPLSMESTEYSEYFTFAFFSLAPQSG